MHPDDVAQVVEEEVEELRARLAAAPELRTGPVELIDRFELRVPLIKHDHNQAHVLEFLGGAPACKQCGLRQRQRVLFNLGPLLERRLILRCDCSGYDARAITAELLDHDGSRLPGRLWPKEVGVGGLDALELPGGNDALPRARRVHVLGPQAIIQDHADYDRPFFCRRGLREYHSFPQHEDNPWDRHRESVRIFDIVPELLADLQTKWVIL